MGSEFTMQLLCKNDLCRTSIYKCSKCIENTTFFTSNSILQVNSYNQLFQAMLSWGHFTQSFEIDEEGALQLISNYLPIIMKFDLLTYCPICQYGM